MAGYFQVPTTVSEYGPNTVGEIARPKTAVVEQARVKDLRGWLIYDVVVNLRSPLKFLKSVLRSHVTEKSADNAD